MKRSPTKEMPSPPDPEKKKGDEELEVHAETVPIEEWDRELRLDTLAKLIYEIEIEPQIRKEADPTKEKNHEIPSRE